MSGEAAGLAWCRRLAEELGGTDGRAGELPPALQGHVLRIAREVAHGTERMNAPLATFIAGRHVAARLAEGATAEVAIAEVDAAVRRLLDGAPPGPRAG